MITSPSVPRWAALGAPVSSLPTSLMVKLALGEAPEHVPAVRDVLRGAQAAASSIDGGAIDRIIGEWAGAFRAARLFSASGPHRQGCGHMGYDSVEQVTGVARALILRVPSGTPVGPLCETLAQIPTVESASPNYVTVTPFDAIARADTPNGDDGWAARRMVRMAEAHAVEPGDDAVIVGLVDSGISKRHVELAGAFRAGYDTVRVESADVAPGVELLGDHRRDDADPEDHFVGHGMGCAGIIAAAGRAMPRGLGGACRIIPMRALAAARLPGRSGAVGLGSLSDLDRATKLAVDLGAKVINMSFGTDDSALAPSSPKPHADVVDYALARGCILIAASGNNGSQTRYWPAAHPGVIAVGSVSASGIPSAFSTRGEHVALCAPGEHVLTTALDGGYQHATGTSFAAPFAAGAAALLVARSHRRARPIDAQTVRRILMRTAQPFSAGGHPGCGTGVLDAAAALAALDGELDSARPDRADSDGGADDG